MSACPLVFCIDVEDQSLLALDRQYAVVVDTPQIEIVTVGEQGPPGVGIPGPAGGAAVQRPSGEPLSALRVVYELNGKVFILDVEDAPNVDLLLGVTLNSSLEDQPVNVQRTGPVDDDGWQWVPGKIWLGSQGAITQSPPVSGFDVLLGTAVSPTRIILNPQTPIELE